MPLFHPPSKIKENLKIIMPPGFNPIRSFNNIHIINSHLMSVEFFKPTTAKAILTIVILVILSFLPIIPAVYIYKCPGCVYTEYHSLWKTLDGLSGTVSLSVGFTAINLTYIIIALEILIPYPISCLIIFLLRKLKP